MVEIKHLCLCLLFSSTHFSVYKDTFAFYKDTKCVQGHAILMPDLEDFMQSLIFDYLSSSLCSEWCFSCNYIKRSFEVSSLMLIVFGFQFWIAWIFASFSISHKHSHIVRL